MTQAYISFGMGGQFFDPPAGESYLVRRCKSIGVDTVNSPYQWSDVNTIADHITHHSSGKVIVGGDSLGANEGPDVARRTTRQIDLLFGFQPSIWGAHVTIPRNVVEAVCIYDPIWFDTLGLGFYPWCLDKGNHHTVLHLIPMRAPHPDDWGQAQDIVFKYIKGLHGQASS